MATEEHIVVVADSRIPMDRMVLEGVDVSSGPIFSVTEVAKVFFGRSSHWIRWNEGRAYFILDGDPDCPHQREEHFEVPDGGGKATKMVSLVNDKGICVCGGVDVGGIRTHGARRYDLSHVERMAHALAQREAITTQQLANAILIVQTVARVWGYIA